MLGHMIELPLSSAELVLISIFLSVITKMILFRLAGFGTSALSFEFEKVNSRRKIECLGFCNTGVM